jgi:hypothetical protein
VVFDYGDPPETLSAADRVIFDRLVARVDSVGETLVTYFDGDRLRAELVSLGFSEIEDLGPRQIAERYFPSRAGAARERGGHIIRAATV